MQYIEILVLSGGRTVVVDNNGNETTAKVGDVINPQALYGYKKSDGIPESLRRKAESLGLTLAIVGGKIVVTE